MKTVFAAEAMGTDYKKVVKFADLMKSAGESKDLFDEMLKYATVEQVKTMSQKAKLRFAEAVYYVATGRASTDRFDVVLHACAAIGAYVGIGKPLNFEDPRFIISAQGSEEAKLHNVVVKFFRTHR